MLVCGVVDHTVYEEKEMKFLHGIVSICDQAPHLESQLCVLARDIQQLSK